MVVHLCGALPSPRHIVSCLLLSSLIRNFLELCWQSGDCPVIGWYTLGKQATVIR